jgi:hypothetical protein
MRRAIRIAAAILMFLVVRFVDAHDLDDQIIVMFKPDIVQFQGDLLEGTIDDLNIVSPDLEAYLREEGIEYVIKAFKDFDPSQVITYARTGEQVQLFDLSNIYILYMPVGSDVQIVADSLSNRADVVYAEQNGDVEFHIIIPNDPAFPGQWALHHTSGVGYADADIDAPEAWDITTGSEDVVIAVIDAGIDADHCELSGRVFGDMEYCDAHGTEVAGVIAARTNNDTMLAGLDWNVRINSQNICESGDEVKYEAVMDAIAAGASILNCSWSLIHQDGTPRYSTTVHLAFMNAYKLNCQTMAAMGNDGDNVTRYPAAFRQGVCAVGASTEYDTVWDYSTTGDHIDVVAPGRHIAILVPDDGTDVGFGTSLATPHVAGIASLLLSYKPDSFNLYNDDLGFLIRIAAERRSGETHWDEIIIDDEFGCGRVNAHNALKLLRPPYRFEHKVSISGPDASVTKVLDNVHGYITGIVGLPSGNYIYDIYKVTKTVWYDKQYVKKPWVWGRGVATTGIGAVEDPSDPVFAVPYIEITDRTKYGFKVSTYVYLLYGCLYAGFYPADPSNVTYAYSIVGIEDVNPPVCTVIVPNGGEEYVSSERISIGWNVADEYLVGVKCTVSLTHNSGMGPWTVLGSNISVDDQGNGEFTYTIPTSSNPRIETHCRIRVTAYDSNNHEGSDMSDSDFTIEYRKKPDSEPIPNQGGEIPPANYLNAPIPNPFNPYTEIHFGVKEPSPVSLHIYDVHGRLVRTFHENEHTMPGRYSVQWNGMNDTGNQVVSGIYFVQLRAGEFSGSKKMILIR